MGSRVSSTVNFRVGFSNGDVCRRSAPRFRLSWLSVLASIASPARAVRSHHARTPRNVVAASLFFSTTFRVCRPQAVVGRNCANKPVLLNNKSVSSILPCGVSGLHCSMLTREGRRRHCSTHIHSSPRRPVYLQSRQRRRHG
jgi:hypothetical protein